MFEVYAVGMDGGVYFSDSFETQDEAEYAADSGANFTGTEHLVVEVPAGEEINDVEVWTKYIYSTDDYSDDDDMRVHAPADDQMDTFANYDS